MPEPQFIALNLENVQAQCFAMALKEAAKKGFLDVEKAEQIYDRGVALIMALYDGNMIFPPEGDSVEYTWRQPTDEEVQNPMSVAEWVKAVEEDPAQTMIIVE